MCCLFKIDFLHTVHSFRWHGNSAAALCLDSFLCPFSILFFDIIFCYLSLMHSSFLITFYLLVSHPHFILVCWYFFDCLPYTIFKNFVRICVLTFSQIIWNLRDLFLFFPFVLSYSKKFYINLLLLSFLFIAFSPFFFLICLQKYTVILAATSL